MRDRPTPLISSPVIACLVEVYGAENGRVFPETRGKTELEGLLDYIPEATWRRLVLHDFIADSRAQNVPRQHWC